ncbi:MAG: HAMP domain-containing protein, partial [Candidatus Omnitrophica bacterium]|nr:HAMP domain-containing protein [Candidatus Omnitrophota bacterium]
MFKKIRNCNIREKFLFSLGMALVFFFCSWGYIGYSLAVIAQNAKHVEEEYFVGVRLATLMSDGLSRLEHVLVDLISTRDLNLHEELQAREQELRQIIQRTQELEVGQSDPEARELVHQIAENYENYWLTATEMMRGFLDHGGEFSGHEFEGSSLPLREIIVAFYDREVFLLSEALVFINNRVEHTKKVISFLMIVAIILTAGIPFVLFNNTIMPIQDLVAGTQRICMGDFSYRWKTGDDNEVGQIASSFNVLAERLQHASKAQQYSEKMIEGVATPVLMVDAGMTIMKVNEEACQFLGYNRDQLHGRQLSGFLLDAPRLKREDNSLLFRDGFLR